MDIRKVNVLERDHVDFIPFDDTISASRMVLILLILNCEILVLSLKKKLVSRCSMLSFSRFYVDLFILPNSLPIVLPLEGRPRVVVVFLTSPTHGIYIF